MATLQWHLMALSAGQMARSPLIRRASNSACVGFVMHRKMASSEVGHDTVTSVSRPVQSWKNRLASQKTSPEPMIRFTCAHTEALRI
eukprot:1109775-Prorocentrum_minimum.AAC.1